MSYFGLGPIAVDPVHEHEELIGGDEIPEPTRSNSCFTPIQGMDGVIFLQKPVGVSRIRPVAEPDSLVGCRYHAQIGREKQEPHETIPAIIQLVSAITHRAIVAIVVTILHGLRRVSQVTHQECTVIVALVFV